MNTAFKDIFDQMTKYKLEARDQIPPLVTKSSILPSSSKVASASSPAKVTTRITETVATTVATATALSVNPTQSSEKVLNQLLDIMKDPNRLKLLEQLLAAINDEIKIDQIINNLPSDRLSQLENALISPLPNKQTDCDDVKDKNENDNDINNNNKYNDLYQHYLYNR
ncbi:hypothetical protein BDF19DRAFT_175985 [Syncephalis fuscata]|nr:hypothetical protein BDF19DRAFT_175985 [Syncephalis fuscata]